MWISRYYLSKCGSTQKTIELRLIWFLVEYLVFTPGVKNSDISRNLQLYAFVAINILPIYCYAYFSVHNWTFIALQICSFKTRKTFGIKWINSMWTLSLLQINAINVFKNLGWCPVVCRNIYIFWIVKTWKTEFERAESPGKVIYTKHI